MLPTRAGILVKLTSTTTVASDCNIYTGIPRPSPAVTETNFAIPPCTISAFFVCDMPQGKYMDAVGVMNSAVRLVNSSGITPLFTQMHWVKVPQRIEFKLAVLV